MQAARSARIVCLTGWEAFASVRIQTRTYSWGIAFAPFGEQYATSGTPGLSFTGEQGTADTVSDEYDFLARKLHSKQGRWISPDPAGLIAANPSDPQTWNRYAYVGNRPLNSTDPSGLFLYPGATPTLAALAAIRFSGVVRRATPFLAAIRAIRYLAVDAVVEAGGGGRNPEPPQRHGGVWPNNDTLGLPTGLNQSPLTGMSGLLSLLLD